MLAISSLSLSLSLSYNHTCRLLGWTKGFTCSGVEGQDVCGLLRKALADEKLNIKVSALVNDTPGTMLAGGYSDPSVCAGLILGTGTNACYLEKVSKAPKLQVCRAQPQSFCTLKKHTKQMLFDFNRCRDGVRRGSEREE